MGRNYTIWFFAVLLVVMWGVTRLELVKGPHLVVISPSPGSGDGPHYFAAVLALLHHQLEMQKVYEGSSLDHHTIVVNRKTGQAADWHNARSPMFKPGPDVYEVSLHAMAYPLLLAGTIWLFDPFYANALRDISLIMVLIGWLGAVTTYCVARRMAWTRGRAVGAAAVLGLASPWLAYTKSFLPETAAGLALILALWALESRKPGWTGLACGVAAAIKPPFVVAGVGFIAERLWTRQWREAAEMLVIFGLCGVGLLYWNWWLARTWIIPIYGPRPEVYPTALRSLYETFLGPKYGLFRFAPWVIFAIPALRYRLDIGISLAFYVLVLAYVRPIASTCYGPRFWVAFLPWLAIAAFEGSGFTKPFNLNGFSARLKQLGFATLVILGVLIAIPDALHYYELFEWPATAAWMRLW